jgi:uncharacterized membrane protein
MYQNRSKFPESEQRSIKLIYWNSFGVFITIGAFLASFAYKDHGGITAILEWVAVLYQLNFFAFTSLDN